MRRDLRGIFIGGIGLLALAAGAGLFADTVTITPSKDNTLYEYVASDGDRSNGSGAYLFTGTTDQGLQRRAVIHFGVDGAVPAGSTINSATLTMRVSRTKSGVDVVRLHRLEADWGEGASNASADPGQGTAAAPGDATWRHRFYSSILWAAPGGQYVALESAAANVDSANNFYSWSAAGMTVDVQAWLDNPAMNFGWIVIGNETTNKHAKRFDSRENTTAANRPMLTIDYTPPANLGACCLPGGTCSDLTSGDCTTAGGTFQGIGVTCASNPCALPTGSCCFNDGSCLEQTAGDCSGAGGIYQGDGGTCTPNPCPQPMGACCLASGICLEDTETVCLGQGGTWQGAGAVCSVTDCEVVLTPFVDPLPVPGAATPVSGTVGGTATYDMPITEIDQRLHRDLPPTRVWGFAGSYPGPTIEASVGQPVTVNWINDLRDAMGNLRTSHYLPVDTCMHGPDTEGSTPRTVIHLHGGHVPEAADGYPEATFLPGQQATYAYPNVNQLPATLWYHDHALGITRLNVIMGMAGFYTLRDAFEAGLGLPSGAWEIPLAIQDRKFNPDGTWNYPAVWQDHFFGDKLLVNGKVWPYLNVDRGKYRFRLLNGSTSRTYTLTLSNGAPFVVIGTEGGLLSAPAPLNEITMGPGERYDVIVDFAPYAAGTEIILTNSAPIMYPGTPGDGVIPNVMKFIVGAAAGHTGAVPSVLRPVTPLSEAQAVNHRDFELQKGTDPCAGSIWTINGMHWDHITEFPDLDTIEVWNFINRSGVSHPMHMHLVMFQVLDRQDFTLVDGVVTPTGPRVPPPAHEAGWKDTVMSHPGQITRVITKFESYKGRYAYHCHILEHEDHEMMRQFRTVDCGDSELDPSEGCDDGNVVAGDACSSRCRRETFYTLAGTAAGGSVSLTIEGVLVTAATGPGDSPHEVAEALAAAINADPTLSSMGVTAFVRGDEVVVGGVIQDAAVSDAGLTEMLTLTAEAGLLWWSSVGGAASYDMVGGDLGGLIGTGDFTAATQSCVADDTTATQVSYPATPPPGSGYWMLVRRVDASGPGSYDTGAVSQVGSRDAEIAASGNACP